MKLYDSVKEIMRERENNMRGKETKRERERDKRGRGKERER